MLKSVTITKCTKWFVSPDRHSKLKDSDFVYVVSVIFENEEDSLCYHFDSENDATLFANEATEIFTKLSNVDMLSIKRIMKEIYELSVCSRKGK